MAPSEPQVLLQALRERNIDLGADDVAWAFESTGTKADVQAWVREYCGEASLLTAEERAFLDKHGQTTRKETAATQQVLDQSFEDAIASLESSTTAIETQCRLLEAQRQALQRLRHSPAIQDAEASSSSRNGKTNRIQSQIAYESDELSDSLRANFRTAAKQTEPGSIASQPSVERVLEKDDRLLDGLEKILPHLHEDDQDGGTLEEAERLCQALQRFTSTDIRTRIDAAYLTGLQEHGSQANGVSSKPSREVQQLASLNAELDELCREIEGLATMAVENQYRKPIRLAVDSAKVSSEGEKTSWLDYLGAAVQHSTGRIDLMLELVDDQRAHANATKAMSSALEEILAASLDREVAGTQRAAQSPIKNAQKGLKPLRLVQANLSDAQDPASQLLRQLDVRPSGELTAASISHASGEKDEKLCALRKNTERSIADLLAQSLAEADGDVQDLMSAILTHSSYSNIYLRSVTARQGIEGLETQTQELSEKMRDLDFEAITQQAQAQQKRLMAQLS